MMLPSLSPRPRRKREFRSNLVARPTRLGYASSVFWIQNTERSLLVIIEKKQRKVSKHGVVTTLGFHEGNLVTVARIDERTEIISLESPEKVEEMVALLTKQPSQKERHRALMEKLQGRTSAPTPLPRRLMGAELDAPIAEAEADKFTHRARGRRPF